VDSSGLEESVVGSAGLDESFGSTGLGVSSFFSSTLFTGAINKDFTSEYNKNITKIKEDYKDYFF